VNPDSTPAEGVDNNFNEGDESGTCSYVWDTESIVNGNYTYLFRVYDLQGNLGTGNEQHTTVIPVPQETNFMIELDDGWNLISIPLIPDDQSTESVLGSIAGLYSKVYFFDSNTKNWEVYNPSRNIFDPPNTLLQLNMGKGYWLEMRESATLTLSGYEVEEYDLELVEGWNYIGYPYLGSRNISSALSSMTSAVYRVYAYNTELEKWDVFRIYELPVQPNTLDVMSPGVGYLIDMKSGAEWSP